MRYLSICAMALAIIAAGCNKPAQPAPGAATNEPPKDLGSGSMAPIGAVPPTTLTPPPPAPVYEPAPAAAGKAGARDYTVQKGDTMFGIARTQLGNQSRWKEIRDMNPEIKDSNTLKAGQVIKIPEK